MTSSLAPKSGAGNWNLPWGPFKAIWISFPDVARCCGLRSFKRDGLG